MSFPLMKKDSVFVYYCNAAGRIIPAPDTRISAEQCGLNPSLWRRCEATGIREIEKISLIISKQMFEEKKARQVTQVLREMDFLKERATTAKLRAAQGFTAKDVEANRLLEAKWKRKQDQALELIALQFDPTRRHSALDMEVSEQSTSPSAHIFQKRQGIA